MRKSTINLTKKELLFANNPQYPLTKQTIFKKLAESFHHLSDEVAKKYPYLLLVTENEIIQGKISRGENYRFMPYLVSDTPQIKEKHFPVLFRVVFWWGHSFVLHYYIRKEHVSKLKINDLKGSYINTGDQHIWENDLEDKSWLKLNKLSNKKISTIIDGSNYIHLAKKVRIKDFESLNGICLNWLGKLEKRMVLKKRKPE